MAGRGALSLAAAAAASVAASCEVATEGSLCLGAGMLLPKTVAPGVVGYWTFDDSLPADESGNGLHGTSAGVAGPGYRGRSLAGGRDALPVEVSVGTHLDGPDFAYTLWVLLRRPPDDAPVAGTCTLLRKGYGEAPESSPRLAVDAGRRLVVELTTTSAAESFTSLSRLRYDTWYHLALVRLGAARQVRLYVNGILDTEKATEGYTAANQSPLLLGADSSSPCALQLFLDEVRAFDRILEADEIGAEAGAALGGTEAAFLRLGCTDCQLDTAMNSCPENYHLCNGLELHTEAYRIAKTLGWISQGTHVWSHAGEANAAAQAQGGVGPGGEMITETLGLGLCCID